MSSSIDGRDDDNWLRMSIEWDVIRRPQLIAKVVVTSFSLAGSVLIFWAIADISHFTMSRITEFDMMIMLITLLMIGNNIQSVATINLFPEPWDPNAHDDMFDDRQKQIYWQEFFEFFFVDSICFTVNLVAFSVWYIVVRQRRLALGRRFVPIVMCLLTASSIPALLKILCRFNYILPCPTKHWDVMNDNCGGFNPDECKQNEIHWRFLNKLETSNICLRVASILVDVILLSHVLITLIRFRNPNCSMSFQPMLAARRKRSEQLATDTGGPASPMVFYKTGEDGSKKKYRTIKGCPMLELCKRQALFPLIQIVTSLPRIFDFFINEYAYGTSPDGGIYGCFGHFVRCVLSKSYVAGNYFEVIFNPMGGFLFALAYFAFQPKARLWWARRFYRPLRRLCLAAFSSTRVAAEELESDGQKQSSASEEDGGSSRATSSQSQNDGEEGEDTLRQSSFSATSLASGTWHRVNLSRASKVSQEGLIQEAVAALGEEDLLLMVRVKHSGEDSIPSAVTETAAGGNQDQDLEGGREVGTEMVVPSTVNPLAGDARLLASQVQHD